MKITSLRVTEKVTKSKGDYSDIPYLVVNITWELPLYSPYRKRFIRDSKDIALWQAVKNPESYENPWLHPPEYSEAWVPQDEKWEYLQKFDAFWFRQYVSDCTVVRSILGELKYYKQNGRFPGTYRYPDESILHRHLSSLDSYWD